MGEPSPGHLGTDGTADRARIWLPLLRELTAQLPIVFKQSAADLAGDGDVDAYAPPGASVEIERGFRSWALREGLRVAVVCRHDWRGPTLVALRDGDRHLFSLDVKVGRLYRGSFLFTTDDLGEVAYVDEHGIRRLRVGADGAIKLLINGTSRSGQRIDTGFAAKRITATLSADRDGAFLASRFVGLADAAFRRGIDAVLAGGWSRRDMALVVAWCQARAIARPDLVVRQLHWRMIAAPSCAIAQMHGVGLPADRRPWLQAVAVSHPTSGYLGIAESDGTDVIDPISAPASSPVRPIE